MRTAKADDRMPDGRDWPVRSRRMNIREHIVAGLALRPSGILNRPRQTGGSRRRCRPHA